MAAYNGLVNGEYLGDEIPRANNCWETIELRGRRGRIVVLPVDEATPDVLENFFRVGLGNPPSKLEGMVIRTIEKAKRLRFGA